MKKVMIFTGGYLPGVKGGGPIQSIKNLVDNLSDVFDFYIVTLDRDLGDTEPYNNVKINQWNQRDGAKIYYIGKDRISITTIKKIINSVSPETIYLNSFFSLYFSIVPIILNKLNLIKPQKLVIAPRGEFSEGALNLKKQKKKFYLKLSSILKLYIKDNLYWHATSEYEKQDILNNLDVNNSIYICTNFTAKYGEKTYNNRAEKEAGKLKLIFLSRITPKKNIKYAIDILRNINSGKIIFDIYGPIEDKDYWELCKNQIAKLPPNIKVRYKGLLQHSEVISTFENYHFFFFPTLGENFGHVISEALIGGCPVITSDQTPWRDLEKLHIGWDISLENTNEFYEIINKNLYMDNLEYLFISESAFNYAQNLSSQKEKKIKMNKILE